MKIIVQYSGGKDSQATLIWACKKYGADRVDAVFCDTGWESPITYKHIIETTKDLGVELIILKSKKYDGFIDLVIKKKIFPSSNARFCTEELKIKPFIDYVVNELKTHFLAIQGIRADESVKRSKMEKECRLFKYYLEPYKYDKKGKPRYHNYLKKDVLSFIKKYDDSIMRPVFNWSAKQVIDYIIKNGQEPYSLYKMGFLRVGCFPCIMLRHEEFRSFLRFFPERIDEIIEYEEKIGNSFFKAGYIPDRFCSKSSIAKKGKNKGKLVKYPAVTDVVRYLTAKNLTKDMFEPEEQSCMSFYGLCE